MRLLRKILIICILLCQLPVIAQQVSFDYYRKLEGVSETWHSLQLPDDVFGKVKRDLSDIRIYGVTEESDTVEVPYLINLLKEELVKEDVSFHRINTSNNAEGYYFTFETPTQAPINRIDLDFHESNFDWRLRLEGSHDQNEWFTIVDDYRIVAIDQGNTPYTYSRIELPESVYQFFRLLVKSDSQPHLMDATMTRTIRKNGVYRECVPAAVEMKNEDRETLLNIDLPQMVPISQVKIEVQEGFDYYRPVTIRYVKDSFKTAEKWKYRYESMYTGTLSSFEADAFQFSNTIARRLQIAISNHDNEPLKIGAVKIEGNVYQLVMRFTTPATYYLTYDNSTARKPAYDIQNFSHTIPKNPTQLVVGKEIPIPKAGAGESVGPLFASQWWLWSVILLTILLLGGFVLKMIHSVK